MYIPYSEREDVDFESLVGKTLTKAEVDADVLVLFETSDGEKYAMLHEQDCCESVYIEDINGDLSDLIGQPILMAEEAVNYPADLGKEVVFGHSETWTFYKIATIKGTVVIRWYGTSNGYYSESVDFVKITKRRR